MSNSELNPRPQTLKPQNPELEIAGFRFGIQCIAILLLTVRVLAQAILRGTYDPYYIL